MSTRAAAVALLLAGAVLVAGCGARTTVLETGAAPLDTAGVVQIAKTADLGPAAGVTVADAPAKRSAMLAALRTRGTVGDRAATFLTRGFPEQTAAIPVLVRECRVNGVDAIVVVEAYGSGSGALTMRRLWIFDAASGAVIRAGTYR